MRKLTPHAPNPVGLPLEHILLKGEFPTILISAFQQLPSRRLSFSTVTETKKKLAYPKKQPSDLLETHKVFPGRGWGGWGVVMGRLQRTQNMSSSYCY